jgi:rRNA processing protein Krr1/Pno1
VARGYCSLTHASTTEQSISIPDKKRGVVIGAKGINLRTIQDKCSVKINIPEKGSDTDDVTIVGDAKDVAEALAAITQLMEQGFSEITHANYVKVDMEVQRDMLKVLIGSGGATIKSLQTTHSVQIAVSPDRSGDSSTITVLGALEEVTAARQAIALLLVAPEPTPIDPLWSKEASASLVDTW